MYMHEKNSTGWNAPNDADELDFILCWIIGWQIYKK
jgi:hypothetical protein